MLKWLTRTLTAILALLGLLFLAAALTAQELNTTPAPSADPDPTAAGTDPALPTRADRDLGAAARTYERVYDRLSYGDRHLVEQLMTNRRRSKDLTRLLEAKQEERLRLDDRVADQLGRIRRLYPAGESKEAVAELAHEYDATRKDLESEIAGIRADLQFARERIAVIEAQLRTIHARSIGKGYSVGRARLRPVETGASTVDAAIIADLEKLRRRVILRRLKRLAAFELQGFDPATCGRAGDFRTALFQVMK